MILAALGVAFAASCIWLAVRIVNRRERWAIWTAAALVIALPVLWGTGFFETLYFVFCYHG